MTNMPFRPKLAATVTISATTAASAKASLGQAVRGRSYVLSIHNMGAKPVFVTWGSSAITAKSSKDIGIAAGAVRDFTVVMPTSLTVLYGAAISSSGAQSVCFTPGTMG